MSTFHDSYAKPQTKNKQNTTTKKSWSCNKCDQRFSKLIKLSSHLEVKHKVEVTWKPYKCNVCSKSFYYKKAKETHAKLHRTDGKALQCKDCGKNFSQRQLLVKHQSLETICEVCGEKLGCPSMLLRHKRRHGYRNLQCSVCSMKFAFPHALNNHMASHSQHRKSFSCEHCSAVFTNIFNLRRHTSRFHDSIDSLIRYSCCRCNNTFKQKDNCWRHYLRVHCNLKRFLCGICGVGYSSSHVLRKHLNHVHTLTTKHITKEATLDVRIIPEHAVIEGLLADNVQKARKKIEEAKKTKYFKQINHPNQCWKCEACGNIFSTEENLRSHVNAKLSCDHCHDTFCSSENLQKHMSSSHSSETQLLLHLDVLQCNYCDAVFLSEEEYQRHISTHLIELGFSCSDCNMTFLDEKQLESHRTSVHPSDAGYVHCCGDCSLTFANESQLEEHRKNVHGEVGVFGAEFQIPCLETAIENQLPASVSLDEKLYCCSHCDASNMTAGDAISHASYHKNPADVKAILKEVNLGLYSCGLCSAVMLSEKQLQEHCQSHIGSLPVPSDGHQQSKAKDVLEMLTRDILTSEGEVENDREIAEMVVGRNRQNNVVNTEEQTIVQVLYSNEAPRIANHFVSGNQQDIRGNDLGIGEVLQAKQIVEHQEPTTHIVHVMKEDQTDTSIMIVQCDKQNVRDGVNSRPFIKAKPIAPKKKTDSSTQSVLQFPCKYCAKSFSSKRDLKVHGRNHTKEKSYSCRSCGKSFRSQQTLKDHENAHNNMKPYKCDICDKAFSRKKAASRHQLTHDKIRNSFGCPLCGKKFVRRVYLKNVHLPSCQQPSSFKFRCKLCRQGFASRTKLWQHTRLHTKDEEKPHQCSECQKCFRLPRYLKAHQICCLKKAKKKKSSSCEASASTDVAFPVQLWDGWVVERSEEMDAITNSSTSNTDTWTKSGS